MSPPGCQIELISININMIPNYEIQTILAEKISKAYPNHKKIVHLDLSRLRELEQGRVSHP